ncbi:hypothetical protein BKA93DRAFT_747044 [Sparassis latifolia]
MGTKYRSTRRRGERERVIADSAEIRVGDGMLGEGDALAGVDFNNSDDGIDMTDTDLDVSILEGVGVTEGSVGLVTVDRDKGYPPSPASTSPALAGVTLPLLLPFSYASGIVGIPEGVFAGGLRAIFFDGLVLRSGLSIKLGRGAIPLQVKRSGRTTSQHAAAPEQAVVMYCWLSHFPGW